VEAENFHLTIKFLGNLEDATLQRLQPQVLETARGVQATRASLGELGVFGKPGRPRVLWIDVAEGREALIDLHGRLENSLQASQIAPRDERPYAPHLTLARARTRQALVLERGFFETAVPAEVSRPFPVDQLTLFLSELTSAGPIYSVISQMPLCGPG
jgi:2'-5' RNA ligase